MKQIEGSELRHIDIGHLARCVRRDPVNYLFASSEAWATTTLGEIADIRNGATPSTHISANWDGSIPWCTPTDITNAPGKYLTETARSITDNGLAGCGASLLPAGALLLCSRATIGEIKIALSPICTNQGFKSLVCTKQVHNEFLYYLILTLKPRLVQKAIGSTFLEIGKHALASMEVRLPLLKEQRAIAEALSDVDGLLESLELLIAKKRAIKQATMQQLLTGKTRLPGFSDEWKTKRIRDFTDCIAGGTPSTFISEYWGGAIRWMSSGELNDKIIFDVEGRITDLGLRESNTKIIPPKCTLIGLAGQGKTRGTVAFSKIELCINQSIAAIYPNESFFPEYLYHNLDARYDELRGMSTGDGGRGGLNLQIIRAIDLPFPTIDEQCAIATVLSDMDAEIAALEQRRDKTHALKQGMMQQLLTGKIRLIESVQTTTRQASAASTGKGHNWQINEAVVISVLAERFGNEEYPLSRMRYTKLLYLLHRHVEGHAEGYLKKAAGPYNPRTRYGGPEKIALKNHYMRRHGNGSYRGFIAGENIEKAKGYFSRWYGDNCLKWLDQFRYERSGDLELLTTVDLAAEELREAGKGISVESVREAIRGDPEWQAKLKRSIFSDANISRAIDKCRTLFDPGHERPKP